MTLDELKNQLIDQYVAEIDAMTGKGMGKFSKKTAECLIDGFKSGATAMLQELIKNEMLR